MARDYARSSNIIYNPVEAEKKRHSSGRDYRSSVSGSGTRDYRTATVKETEAKKTPEVEQAFPMLPNLGQSINNMNNMANVGNDTLKLGIVAPQTNPFASQKVEQNASSKQLLRSAPNVRTYENVERDAEPFSNLREIPIAGAVYRGLDRLQEFTEPAAKIAQEFYTPGAGLAPIAGFTGAVGSVISKAAPKLGLGEGLGKAVAREAIKEGAAGAVLGAGQSLAAHPEAGFEGAGTGALYGGVLGGALGPVAPLLGKAIKGIIEKWKPAKPIEVPTPQPTQPTLGLPLGRLDAAGKRPTPGAGVITPEYTFRLGAGNDMAPKIHEARNDLKAIDSELRGINQQYEKAIVDEFQYLKQSMVERGGVTQGNIITDNMGNVIDRYGRQSNNPKWYQNFFAENGRKPSNKELYQLAKERVDNGFSDEMGDVPSWKTENGYDETVAALTDVRNTIYKTIGEAENAFQVTDAPLKSNELSFKPKARIEQEAPQAPRPVISERTATTAAPLKTGSNRVAEPAQAPRQQQGIRANYANQLNNGNFSPEMQQGIRNTDQRYDIAHNVDTVAAANQNVKNLTKAEADFHGNEIGGAEHIATGYRLMQELDALGEHQRALNVANKLAKDLTESGQRSQAASILSRLSPEGQLLNLIRTAERHGKQVTVADQAAFKQEARTLQESLGAGIRENKLDEILARAEKDGKISAEDSAYIQRYIDRGEKVINPEGKKTPPVEDFNLEDVFPEMKNPKKREKVISFLDKQEQAALERIKARKNRLNALPLDEWADHAIVVASQLGKGTIKAATHVEDLVKLFGEEIRPVATKVYQKAQTIVKVVARSSAEGKLDEAIKAMDKATGKAAADKALVQEMADHVKKVIEDAKNGNVLEGDLQKLRDYSDEISDMLEGKPTREISQEQKYLQNVKALAKKIADVESKAIPADQANKEIASLIRKVANDPLVPKEARVKMDEQTDTALNNIASDVMKRTRKAPTPTTLQEKIVEKYIKQNPQVSAEHITKLRELAKDVTRLESAQGMEADMAMQKIMNSYEKSNIWDKVTTLRYIGMLLNTGTQLINAGSGPIMASTGLVSDIFGTMLDTVLSKALKQPRTTTLYGANPLDFLVNYMSALKKGAKAGWEGVNPAGIQSTGEIRGLTFKSLKNPLTIIPAIGERTLGAVAKGADFAAYSAINKGEMIKQGYLDAINNGVKGRQAIKQHINKFVNDPTEAAILQADRIAKNATFQRSDTTAGKVANYVNSAPAGLRPFLSAIFPFVRTPINIASTAVTMTPAGIIKGLFQLTSKSAATKREAIRTLSLGLTGSGIGVLGYYLSDLGIITGANDSGNKDVDAIREQAGQGKYRFNTSALMRYLGAMVDGAGTEAAKKAAQYREGDKQFDYNKLQPLAFPLAVGAGVEKNKGKGAAGTLAGAGTDAYGSLYGMSTLKGVQDVFQPSYGGTLGEKALGAPSRIVESFLKSFSPSLLAQEARRQDPIVRKVGFNNGIVQDVKESFMSRTPGLSQKLPPSKTTLGQDKKNAPGIKGQYLNPYKSDIAPYNEAAVIVSGLIDRTKDLSLAPTAPEKKVTGKDRTGNKITVAILPDRYAKLQEDIGKEITSKIVSMNQSQSDADQSITIEKIYAAVRKKYMDEVKKELGIQVQR